MARQGGRDNNCMGKMGETMKITFEVLKEALINILDGQSSWYEIREMTGLIPKEAKKIEKIFKQLVEEG